VNDNIARGLGDLMRKAQDRFEADAAQASSEVAGVARSRRRRSGALFTTVTVVACVAVGAAGIGIAQSGSTEPTPSFSASPSPVPSEDLSLPRATATIPILGGPQYQGIDSLLECGAPAPAPTGTVEHFGVTIAEPAPLTIAPDALLTGQDASVETWITYDSADTVPVAQLPVTLVLVKDGKVEGSFTADYSAQQYWTYSDLETFYGGSSLSPYGAFCPSVSTSVTDDGSWATLNPGEYQVVPMTRVWATPEAAALKYLYKKGINVVEYPPRTQLPEFLPGSWDCKQTLAYGLVPRVCLGDAMANAIVDTTAGTVTLPYDPDQLTKTLDVTLVGNPVALRVTGPVEPPDSIPFEVKPLDVADPIECGTTFDYTTPEAPLLVSGTMPNTFGTGSGAYNAVNADILAIVPGTGEVELEYGAKAWLVSGVAPDYNYFAPRAGNERIVGSAEVSIAGGNTVEYDRYAGPTRVDLVFSNVQLCEDFNSELGLDSAIIDGNISITPTGEPPRDPKPELLYFREYFQP